MMVKMIIRMMMIRMIVIRIKMMIMAMAMMTTMVIKRKGPTCQMMFDLVIPNDLVSVAAIGQVGRHGDLVHLVLLHVFHFGHSARHAPGLESYHALPDGEVEVVHHYESWRRRGESTISENG